MLISRVQAIITENQDKRPQFTSQIQTFFRQEFSKYEAIRNFKYL